MRLTRTALILTVTTLAALLAGCSGADGADGGGAANPTRPRCPPVSKTSSGTPSTPTTPATTPARRSPGPWSHRSSARPAPPYAILLLHQGTYLGTATAQQYAFEPTVERRSDAALTVTYRFAEAGEPNAAPSGRTTATFAWNDETSRVDMTGDTPHAQ